MIHDPSRLSLLALLLLTLTLCGCRASGADESATNAAEEASASATSATASAGDAGEQNSASTPSQGEQGSAPPSPDTSAAREPAPRWHDDGTLPPLDLPPPDRLSVGGSVCYRAPEGEVWCWGSGMKHEPVEGNDIPNALRPERFPDLEGVVDFAGSYLQGECAAFSDGRLRCWGGQLRSFQRPLRDPDSPWAVWTMPEVADVARVSGRGPVTAWLTHQGEIGYEAIHRDEIEQIPAVDEGDRVINLGIGAQHACALTAQRRVYCWGHSHEGQAGLWAEETEPVEIALPVAPEWLEVGGYTNCVGGVDGKLYCWGSNAHGIMGDLAQDRCRSYSLVAAERSGTLGRLPPEAAARMRDAETPPCQFNAIAMDMPSNPLYSAASSTHSICVVVGTERRVWCRGANGNGHLGTDREVIHLRVEYHDDVIAEWIDTGVIGAQEIATSGWTTCALTGDEEVFCWGGNNGKLGNGTSEDSHRPVKVEFEEETP